MLAAIGLDLSDGAICRDELSRKKIQARAALPGRDHVVRPRHPDETVYLASLRVLGWDQLDVMRALAEAHKHKAKVYCVDVGEVIVSETPAGELLQILTRSEEARRRSRTSPAQKAAREVEANRIAKAIAEAEKLWPLPSSEITVKGIAAKVGVSVRTLYTKLSDRSTAQEEALHGKRHT